MRPVVRKVGYWVAWNHPRLYLWLIVNLRLKRSKFFQLSQACKVPLDRELPRPPDGTAQVLSRPKKILFVIHWYELGGAESYALYTMRVARELGYTCYCISTVPSSNSEREAFAMHCDETLAYSAAHQGIEFEKFVAKYIRERSIDIVHIHHSYAMYEALSTLKEDAPQLLVVDSTHIVEHGNGGFPQLSAQYSPYIHKHNVISQNLMAVQRELFKQMHGSSLRRSKFHLAYLASLAQFTNQLPRKPGSSRRVITFFGRFVLQKQPNIFVAVIEQLASMYPELEVEAHIYGEGELGVDLTARLIKSRYQERFRLRGRCDDPRKVLAESDILFLPSLNEGLSLTVYEALSLGRLVVSSDVGAQSELVCADCLIPLSPRFIEEAAIKLHELLVDEKAYDAALEESRRALYSLQERSVNSEVLSGLYQAAP